MLNEIYILCLRINVSISKIKTSNQANNPSQFRSIHWSKLNNSHIWQTVAKQIKKLSYNFNRRVISTHYCCIYILVLITLKMATRVVEPCRLLLYNNITFIDPSAFFWSFKHFLHKLHMSPLWRLFNSSPDISTPGNVLQPNFKDW